MTANTSTIKNQTASWHRDGHDWHLIRAGGIQARIERDSRRWLCYALDEAGNETYLGPCQNLASGKAHFSVRYAPQSSEPVLRNEEAPL
jgi:hypothetical protein